MNINERCLVVRGRSHHVTMHGISAESAPWHEIETLMKGWTDKKKQMKKIFQEGRGVDWAW